ncbi:MAG: YcjF family protein [Defluviitaleaceae bacterium]|nr:YcjF family protein [Defluviitaleaceae bacterium]
MDLLKPNYRELAQQCIDSHAKQAIAVSFIPLVSLPVVYGVCTKMIVKLDKIFGITTELGWDSEIVQDVFAGIVAAPALLVPFLGAGAAAVFVKSIGKNYAAAVIAVIENDDAPDLSDAALISQRVREELKKIHATRRGRRSGRMQRNDVNANDV